MDLTSRCTARTVRRQAIIVSVALKRLRWRDVDSAQLFIHSNLSVRIFNASNVGNSVMKQLNVSLAQEILSSARLVICLDIHLEIV